MSVTLPGRHAAFAPLGRLRVAPPSRKKLMMALNLTAMVDMFTVIVIFLLQSFDASPTTVYLERDLELPSATNGAPLAERAPVVTLAGDRVVLDGVTVARAGDLDPADATVPALDERLARLDDADRGPGPVALAADGRTDASLVRKTLGSLNRAGWTDVRLLVTPRDPAAR